MTVMPDVLETNADRRQAMIDSQLRTSDVIQPAVVAAFAAVDRAAFVPAEHAAAAYSDRPVPLGNGRMLNPPLTTGRLIADLAVVPGQRVLVAGGATGYAAALLAAMGAEVVALEPDADLRARAETLVPAGIRLVGSIADAGQDFDALLVDGAIAEWPSDWAALLRDGARVATGLSDGAVTRLARGVRVAGQDQVALFPFADLECVRLPGHDKPAAFSF